MPFLEKLYCIEDSANFIAFIKSYIDFLKHGLELSWRFLFAYILIV